MAKFTTNPITVTVGGMPVVVRALSARERQGISARCKNGEEMTNEAVLLCTSNEDGSPFFADLSEILDAPCGYIAKLGEEILTLSGMGAGDKENPT